MGFSNIAFSNMVILAETQSPVTVFFAQHGIQVVLAVMTIYYAVKLLVFKDVDSVRPKEWKKLKEENVEPYAREAGILALGFAACLIFMEIVSMYDGFMALLFMILAVSLMFFRFKKIEEKYGEKNPK
jgi:ABC-type xylose transport system permease subunit